jgi:hypothetical protein
VKGFVVSLQIGNLNTRYIYIQMHIDACKHTHTHNNMMPSLTNADYGAYIHRPRPLDVSPSPSFDRTSSGHNPGLGSPPKATRSNKRLSWILAREARLDKRNEVFEVTSLCQR